jgi:hypothetical protein
MDDGTVTANTNDLMNASKGAANVGGEVPGVFAGAASSLGTAAAVNPGGFMGPAGIALSVSMAGALSKLGAAVNGHSDLLADAATKFRQADQAMLDSQKPITDGLASNDQSMQGLV